MRERHNIVGTEVGRPRAPIYTRPRARIQGRRAGAARPWIITLALVATLGLAVAVLAWSPRAEALAQGANGDTASPGLPYGA